MTIQIFIYYLIYLGARKVPRKIKQHIFFYSIFNREISISNTPLINNISKVEILEFRLASRNHAHCILKILLHLTRLKYYFGNIYISGIFHENIFFLS